MRHSIEARLPFLDYRLVESGYHLDSVEKVGQFIGKKVIRKSMVGKIPQQILENTVKKGFGTPQRLWLSSNKQTVHEQIAKLTEREIFNNQSLRELLDSLLNDDFDDGLLMRLYSLSVWYDVFNVAEDK